MTQEINAELQKQIREILDGLKKRDEETGRIHVAMADDIKRYGKEQEGTKDAIAGATKAAQEMHGRLHDLEQKIAKAAESPARELSIGEKFANDPKLREFAKDAYGLVGTGVKARHRMEVKTITSIAGSAGTGIFSDRLPGVIEESLRPLTIRALLDQGTTESNLIEWVRELVNTNNADMVSEGTLKPESNITYQRLDVPVRTIAHWIRASKQVLADFKQLATLINGRLRWGLKIKEEDQLLYGDGTGENLDGLVPNATAYNTSFNTAGDTMIDTIRHAILQVRLAFYPASGIVMSPVDWHYLELTKDNQNRYMIASPTARTPPMLWGLPVVESDGMSKGDFLVGAFRLAATLFDREIAGISISTEDQDNFVRNLVTILCEERLALAITRPQAFVFGGFPAGSTT